MNIKSIVRNHTKLTEDNQHGDALHLIACQIKDTKYLKLLKAVQTILETEGYLPHQVSAYQYQLSQEIWAQLATEQPELNAAFQGASI